MTEPKTRPAINAIVPPLQDRDDKGMVFTIHYGHDINGEMRDIYVSVMQHNFQDSIMQIDPLGRLYLNERALAWFDLTPVWGLERHGEEPRYVATEEQIRALKERIKELEATLGDAVVK